MITLLNILVSLLIPLALGYLLTTLLTPKGLFKILPALAISYGLGVGIISQIMLMLGIFEIPLSLNNIQLPSIICIILLTIGYFIKIRKLNPLQEKPDISFNPSFLQQCLMVLMFLYIGYNIIFMLWRTFYFPIQAWDAIATIGFKAKVIFFDQTIHRLNLPWGSYPLLVPFTESWTAFNLGYWDDILVKTTFPIFSISFLIIQYYFVRDLTNKLWATFSLCLTLSSSFYVIHSGIGYREIVVSYYTCVSVILLLMWNKNPHPGLLILASLFAGLMTFTKLEGTGYLLILYVLFFLMLYRIKTLRLSDKTKFLIYFLLPSFCICFIFHLYKYFINVASLAQRTQLMDPNETLFRFLTMLKIFFENLFLTGNWNLIWFLLVAGIFLKPKYLKNQEEAKLTSITLAMFFGLYLLMGTFTVAFNSLTTQTPSTVLSRVILHFYPLAVLLIIFLNFPEDPAQENLEKLNKQNNVKT